MRDAVSDMRCWRYYLGVGVVFLGGAISIILPRMPCGIIPPFFLIVAWTRRFTGGSPHVFQGMNLFPQPPTYGMSGRANVTDATGPEHRAREDELLVIRCQLGERSAFDELTERWHPPLWKYVRRLAGEDDAAKDVAQDVWLRVLRGIGRLRDGSRLRPWLFGIARRALMDRLGTSTPHR